MDIVHLHSKVIAEHDTPLLVLPVYEENDSSFISIPDELAHEIYNTVDGSMRPMFKEDVKSKMGESLLVYLRSDAGPQRILFVGLGEKSSLDSESLRRFGGHAVRGAESLGVSSLTIYPGCLESEVAKEFSQAVVEGAVMAQWDYNEMKTDLKKNKDKLLESLEVLAEEPIASQVKSGIEVGKIIGGASNFARTLQSRPGNVATPTHLGEEASRIASEYGLKVMVMGPEEIKANDMQALLAV